MKTTLDLDDALLIEAKTVAAKRRTTLKAVVEHALRRELAPAPEITNPDPEKYEIGPLGFLVLKRKPGDTVTLEQIQAIQKEIDEEEFQRALTAAGVFPNLPASDDLTDLYLLGLAVRHGGRFATFDQRIDAALIPGGPAAYFIIPPS